MSEFNYNRVLDIKHIKSNINFWLVRSKGGVFYDEFKNEEYIALGWNYIDSENIYESNDEKVKALKTEIERIYKNKQGGTIFNKCDRFINDMHEGDIVMVPSAENNEILFATVGDYYEDDKDYIHELEIINRIDSKEDYGIEIKCPYKKRRSIIPIKTIKGERLNPNLFRALTSYHGISSINKYADYILSSIYNLYLWNDKLNLVVNIEKRNDIGAIEFSGLIYSLSNLLSINEKEIIITTKANVNSPGDLVLQITSYANSIYDYIVSNWLVIVIAYGALFGIKFGPITINSIPEFFMKLYKDKVEIDNKKVDLEIKKIELETKQMGLDEEKTKKIKESADMINTSAEKLDVDIITSSKVIKVDFFKKYDEF